MRTAILDLVYVGLGGFLGSIGRYLASGAVHQIFPNVYFPIGTAVVNIIGCFLIGVSLPVLRNFATCSALR
jgi:CrcB protein